ncbi:IS30 family transposase [Exiguobacterium sp. TNDT2]|uniref:IS30 family transposase n=1 Tax=Exiguobacterium sp. TNDT2 TaxID=2233531 RepID=UPI000DEFD170
MSYTHLTTAERVKIETYLELGMSIRSIARRLGRQPSTVSREIRSNPGYTAERAQERYAKAKRNCGAKTKLDDRMRRTIIEKLRATWSPEQIVGRLFDGKIAFSTIYRWIYSGLIDVPVTVLRQKGKRQKPMETRGRFNIGLSIAKRPREVRTRETFGHWELDTVVYDISQEGGSDMFWITRVPRTVAIMLTGAAMAMSGLVMQLITQNRLVEPTTTGTLEWAGLGLLAVYLLVPAPTLMMRMTGAIVFSFIGTMVFFWFLRSVKLRSSLIVPIIGLMLGAVVSAVSTFLGLFFQASQIIEGWFVGSFASVQVGRYEYLWLIILVTFFIFILANRLTLAGLGEDIATSLGVNYSRLILIATGLIALAVGVVATVIGNLPFLGLIVPNIVSMFRGDDLRSNLPWVCVIGMGTVLVSDLISRTIIMPFELPVSLILGTMGSIVFIMILLRQRKTGGVR